MRESSSARLSVRQRAPVRVTSQHARLKTASDLLVWIFRIRRWISLRRNSWIRCRITSRRRSGFACRRCSRIPCRSRWHYWSSIRSSGRRGLIRWCRISGRRSIICWRGITGRSSILRGRGGRRCSSVGDFNSQCRCQFSDRSQHRGAGAGLNARKRIACFNERGLGVSHQLVALSA